MPKPKDSQLAIKTTIEPPPTKRELVDAMTHVAIAKKKEEFAQSQIRLLELTARANEWLLQIVNATELKLALIHLGERERADGAYINKIKNVTATFTL